MKVVSIKGPEGRRMKAVKFPRAEATYWLLPQDARIALDWANRSEGARGDVSLSGFISANAVRIDGHMAVQPEADIKVDQAKPTVERGWDCGNGHLPAQVALRLISDNRISCCTAMETVAALAHEAGPAFCRSMLVTHDQMDIPF